MSEQEVPSVGSVLRAGLPAVLAGLAAVTLILGLYAMIPAPTAEDSPLMIVVSMVLIAIIYLAAGIWALFRINGSQRPLRTGVIALSVMVTAMVVTFALAYLSLSANNPDSFTVRLDKISALYFTMTVLSTTGFGDITASTHAAMIAVMIQMVVGLTLLTAIARVLVAATRSAGKRRLHEASRS